MNLYDRNRKVGSFLRHFLTFESDGSHPYLQARMWRTRHAREGLFSLRLFPGRCSPSKYSYVSVRAQEDNSIGLAVKQRFPWTRSQPSVWILPARPEKVQENSQREGLGEYLGITGAPQGPGPPSPGVCLSGVFTAVQFSRSLLTWCFQNCDINTNHLGSS